VSTGPAGTAPVLEASGLTKTFQRGPEVVHALSNATLRIDVGEIVALVGPSGSGKTTLLSVLAGWEAADGGAIAWRGTGPADTGRLGWGELAIVPQTLGLVEELTVRENVELPLRLRPQPEAHHGARGEGLLSDLGLVELADRLPGELSLGEQQRAALARALVLRPDLLMADEPTGHQDVGWTRGVLRVLEAAAGEGVACLVATHHRALVRYAHRVISIGDGRLAQVEAGEVVGAGDEL
jgi:ABC-type lipoprotein export system ATPase subunit